MIDTKQLSFKAVDSIHSFVLKGGAELTSANRVLPLGSSLMKVSNADEAASWFQISIQGLKCKQAIGEHATVTTVEYLQVLYLDRFEQVLWSMQFTSGRKSQVKVKIKEIFQGALRSGAEKILLLHNHPSENVQPGKNDLYLTRRIRQAGDVIGIALVDHIIVGSGKYFSFRENGILNNSINE